MAKPITITIISTLIGDRYQVESGARREANGREDESPVDSIDNSWIEGEDVLLLILCGALAIAFYMRRHRLND